jgi:hypothetical protein
MSLNPSYYQLTLSLKEASRQNCDLIDQIEKLKKLVEILEEDNRQLRGRLQKNEPLPVNYNAWAKQVDPKQRAYENLVSQALKAADNVLGQQVDSEERACQNLASQAQQTAENVLDEWEGYGSSCN